MYHIGRKEKGAGEAQRSAGARDPTQSTSRGRRLRDTERSFRMRVQRCVPGSGPWPADAADAGPRCAAPRTSPPTRSAPRSGRAFTRRREYRRRPAAWMARRRRRCVCPRATLAARVTGTAYTPISASLARYPHRELQPLFSGLCGHALVELVSPSFLSLASQTSCLSTNVSFGHLGSPLALQASKPTLRVVRRLQTLRGAH